MKQNRVFWSTLLSGFSVLPLFMLVRMRMYLHREGHTHKPIPSPHTKHLKKQVFTACSNTAMGLLFTAVGDVPHLEGWDDWARLTLSTLGTMIALRNLLVSMYEASSITAHTHNRIRPTSNEHRHRQQMTMDNTAPYPLLNPALLSRIRSIVAVRPRGLATLVTVLHIHSFCTLYALTALGVKMDNLPVGWRGACHGASSVWGKGKGRLTVPSRRCSINQPHNTTQSTSVFFYNLLLKLMSWQLFLLYEGRLKRLAKRAKKRAALSNVGSQKYHQRWRIFGGGGKQQHGGALGGPQVALLRRLRKTIVWYYAVSDLVILLALAAHYLVLGEGQELLRHQQMAGHDPHRYDELERRVVAFNWCVGCHWCWWWERPG
jgi:hypothetical protein